jgi:integrase
MTAKVIPIGKRAHVYADVDGVPFLKLNKLTGFYYVRKYRAGKGELFKSTKERTKGRARTVAEGMIDEWLGLRRATQRRKPIAAICDELEAFLRAEHENGDRRAKTWEHDQNYLPLIRELFGDVYPDEIDEDYWADWVVTKGRKLGINLFDISKKLSKLLTFAYRKKYIGRKPTIKNPDKQSKKGRVVTDAEILAILEHADETLTLQIVLAYECGLRTGEIRGMRWDWLADGVLTLPEWFVKANARAIQLSHSARQMLLARTSRWSEFVFPAPKDHLRCESAKVQNKRWRKAVKLAGIKGRLRFYDLRHTFYNRALLELGLPVQTVSAYGGTSIRTLQKDYLLPSSDRTKAVASAVKIPQPIRGKLVNKDSSDASSS